MSEYSSNLDGIVDVVLQTILDTTTDMIFVKDLNLVYVGASWSFARLVGKRSPADLIGKTDYDLFPSAELAAHYTEDDRAMLQSGEALLPYVEPLPPENGRPRYSLTTKRILRDLHGAPLGLLGIGRDITQEYEAKINYERELRYLFELPADALSAILLDITDWRIVDVRVQPDKADKLPLYTSIEDYLKHVRSAIVDDSGATVRFFNSVTRDRITKQYEQGKRRAEIEYSRRMSDGSALWVRNEFTILIDPVSGHLTLLALLRDMTVHKQAERALTRAAEQDAMTALYNREATMKYISAFLSGTGAGGRHALFMIDIDNFKQINDTFGHQTGDRVITDIAGVIKRIFRESDVVGRIGGDEFFALMKQAPSSDMIRKKAQELVEALQYVCTANKLTVELTASVGISVYTGDHKPLDALYAEADAALYQAKQHGKNSYALYGSEEARQQPEQEPGRNEPSSALQLRQLLKSMDGEMFLIEVRDELRTVFSSRSGTTVNTLAGMANDRVFPEDQLSLQNALMHCAKTGDPLDFSYRVSIPDGGILWRHLRGSRLSEDAASAPRILCVSTDITLLKQNEEKLAFAELRYRTAAEESGLLLWHVDLREKVLTFYGAAARMLGLAGESFVDPMHTRVVSGAIHPQSVSEFSRMYQDIYAGRESGEYTIISVSPSGREFAARAHYSLLRDKTGQPYLAVGTSVPLLLNQELSLYRKLSRGGVFSIRVDDGFTLLYGNDHFFSLLGYTRESFQAQHNNRCAAFIHPDDLKNVSATLRHAIGDRMRDCLLNMRVITASGQTQYTEVSGEFDHRSDGYYVINGVMIDVTQQKLAELAQKKQQ